MIKIKPFRGWRPAPGSEAKVAAPPYDVLSSEEAREMAKGNALSFLHVTKPEINLDPQTDLYSDEVYASGSAAWQAFVSEGVFVQDATPTLYLYRQGIGGHVQTGIVAASSIDDYFEDRIKKHEFTRPKKENDRIRHMYTIGIHPGPVFLTYKHREEIDALTESYIAEHAPDNDFQAADGVQHTLWVVRDAEVVKALVVAFDRDVEATYIADGHHRAAASAKVGQRIREENGGRPGNHEYFLSVLFPDNQLSIIDYNRLITDLNGHSASGLLKAMEEHFVVEAMGKAPYKPARPREYGMYLEGTWYRLKAKPHTYVEDDSIKTLDVTTLSDFLIDPILGISDQRTDDRIDFVGGIRGLKALEERVDSGEMALALALYPVSIRQLIDIADDGQVMPPKSTWFEPKLRSGLVVHSFREPGE